MLFTVFSIGGFLRKPYSSMVLKILFQKIRKAKKLESIHDVEREK
jgi:hypothetical protein